MEQKKEEKNKIYLIYFYKLLSPLKSIEHQTNICFHSETKFLSFFFLISKKKKTKNHKFLFDLTMMIAPYAWKQKTQ